MRIFVYFFLFVFMAVRPAGAEALEERMKKLEESIQKQQELLKEQQKALEELKDQAKQAPPPEAKETSSPPARDYRLDDRSRGIYLKSASPITPYSLTQQTTPSLILEVRKADILLYNGLDLEVGYLPVLIESSRNPRVQPGSSGYLDCSRFVDPIDRPARADRSMGDVHPLGNPHYHLSPRNIYRVAEGITLGLSRADPGNEGFYMRNLEAFQKRFQEKQKIWNVHELKGKKFLSYHQFFEYLALEFGFQLIGYVEPKPGIPPSAGHVEKLIEILKRDKPHAILTTPYNGEKEVRFLSQKTAVKYIVVPHDVGATAEAKDWFALMDQVLALLK